ncbi:hypothetical protein QP912_08625 [Corynebacterium pseudodiphtheriticum]|uniref:hypothetical protein n=1 Tax=Corynebacterium pseudodiphtheriticum TaxID=37637 RepID=UPI00254C6511|nr:hypothetical protein [Corynebacterium pseudodiphtheriticum]MDK8699843.1 hypothetical protein [Corynebacterium pseudodiphtheriticum]MDK8775471.1 hypothetical protein [Corynebacterium pseudodiphtheriticum]
MPTTHTTKPHPVPAAWYLRPAVTARTTKPPVVPSHTRYLNPAVTARLHRESKFSH